MLLNHRIVYRSVAAAGAKVLILAAAAGCWSSRIEAGELVLVRDGEPAAVIVVAKDPTRSAHLAAAEMQYHVRKITGATLPIVGDDQSVAGNRVLVGESRDTRALGLKSADFAPQEYLIRFQPGVLVLMGRDQPDRARFDYADTDTFPARFDEQSTCYAVYAFLERYAQVRWYLPTELGLCCPAVRTLAVWGGDVRRSPAMKHRDILNIDYRFPADLCGDTVTNGPTAPRALPWREQLLFALRHRLRGTLPYTCNHSLYGYYDRFWKEGDAKPGDPFEQFHPEFFAQGYQGRPPQMCYTNPAMVRQVVQDARDYFDGKGLKRGSVAAGDFFAVVPMDNSSYCKCPRCAQRIGHKRAPTQGKGLEFNDAASNYLFAFVNDVAREVKKSHPQKQIATLAYASYAYPPTEVKLESNVCIQICLHARNLYSPIRQQNDRAILDAWVAESTDRPKRLWLYYCFPSLGAVLPGISGDKEQWRCFPGFFAHAIERQMRLYRETGIGGISYEPSYIAYNQRSPLLDQLEFYVTWKLADDPSLNGNALIDEFFERYYGEAAVAMKAFYELVEQTYVNPANYPPAFCNQAAHQSEQAAWGYLGTEERMDRMARLMDQASAAAKTELEKQRVALFRKGIWDYMANGRKQYLAKQQKKP